MAVLGDRELPALSAGSGRALVPESRVPAPAPRPRYSRQSNDELRRLSAMLRRRAGLIALGAVTVLGAVIVFTLVWPRSYRSSALIVVERRAGGDASLVLLGELGRASQIETEIELLKSRRVMERVADALDLHVSVTSERAPGSGLGATVRRALSRSPPPQRPGVAFTEFDAGADAFPGRYRVAVDPAWGIEVRDAWGRVLARGGQPQRFAGMRLGAADTAAPRTLLLQVKPFAEAVGAARKRVSVRRNQREADLIGVDCTGRTPTEARVLCQSVLDGYMQLRTELRRAEATATAQFLRGQVDLLAQRLASAEDSVRAYGTRHGVVALGERAAAEVRQLTQVTAQRDQLVAEHRALSGLIEQIERGAGGTRRYRDLASFPTFLQNQAVTQLLVSLVNLENERSTLRLRRSESSADVVALDQRIAEIEQQLLAIGLSYRQALEAQLESLDDALRVSGQRLAAIPQQQMQSARLERQVSLLDQLYVLLKTRLREAEVAEAVNLPNVRVVDPASLPLRPAHPRTSVNLVLGTVLGLVFGLALALYREGTDDSIRERREVEHEFGIPVLALIPPLGRSGVALSVPVLRRAPRSEVQRPVALRLLAGAVGSRPPPGRSSHRVNDERRAVLEAFAGLAWDVRCATAHLNGGAPAVAVTSAVRDEGKTFVACNLALAQTAQGARTLLIDADVRGGGGTRFFGLPSPAPGLSDILAANGDAGEIWPDPMTGSGLWVTPPGSPGLYSARLFQSPGFTALLAAAKQRFDLVVIDLPPVTLVTEAAAIAAAADGVLLVVRGALTTRDLVDHALERLERAGSRVVGAVLNGVAPPRYSNLRDAYTAAAPPGRRS